MLINEVFEQVDALISDEEQELIRLSNERYDGALKAAIEEFKLLLQVEGVKASNPKVQDITKKAMEAFDKEFKRLTEPIIKATLKAYDLGLKETGQIIEESKKNQVNPER